MSNEMTIFENGLPDYIKNLPPDAATKALMGSGSAGGMKRISIKGGVWRMMVGGKEITRNEDRALNVVVVAASETFRTYYDTQYKEGITNTGPVCWSTNSQTPDPKSSKPQASRCIDCPQNVKGSGQGDSRACRYNQRLAVVLANDIEKGDIYQLQIPPASIFGDGEPGKWPIRAYATMLFTNNVPITAVATEMRFDTNSATPRITFKPAAVLSVQQQARIMELAETTEAKQAITLSVAEVDKVKAAIGLTVEEPAVVEEPVKKVSKKDEAPTPKKDVNTVLEEWDD